MLRAMYIAFGIVIFSDESTFSSSNQGPDLVPTMPGP
jgi:hypothetical protein